MNVYVTHRSSVDKSRLVLKPYAAEAQTRM